jgi:hypothetical protein
MKAKEWLAFAGLVVVPLCIFSVAVLHNRYDQDVVCFDERGRHLFHDKNVRVRTTFGRIEVRWPGGKMRTLVSGSCEWAPHSEDGEYSETETRRWRREGNGLPKYARDWRVR